jgi:hypothetical protein
VIGWCHAFDRMKDQQIDHGGTSLCHLFIFQSEIKHILTQKKNPLSRIDYVCVFFCVKKNIPICAHSNASTANRIGEGIKPCLCDLVLECKINTFNLIS